MENIFLKIFNLSLTASWIVLAVLLLRLLLKKAPKWINCLLWGIVGLRLLMPFSLESVFSLIPSAQPLPQNIATIPTPSIDSGFQSFDNVINPIISDSLSPSVEASVNPMQIVLFVASIVWVVGIVCMLVYGLVSYLRLYRRVRPSLLYRENIYYCDNIDTPFILGVFRPRIYLPSGIGEEHAGYVIAHERAHRKRGDHLWKPIGFLLLSVYWFNPALWIAYILLCRDIEKACDEKVIKDMEATDKKGYSEALVACSVHRRMIMACPLAFGEVGIKERVKNVLNYKKPAFWIIIVAVAAIVVAAVCLLTDPVDESQKQPDASHINDKYNGILEDSSYSGTLEDGSRWFDGVILQVSAGKILVEPHKASKERKCADQIWVSTVLTSEKPLPWLSVGSPVYIVYDGMIAETYPAQINSVSYISTSTTVAAEWYDATIMGQCIAEPDRATALNREQLFGNRFPIYKIETIAELEALCKYREVLETYDAAYFEKNALILTYITAASGSNRYEVGNIRRDGSSFVFCINEHVPGIGQAGTDDIQFWLAIAQISKAELSVLTSFDAVCASSSMGIYVMEDSDDILPCSFNLDEDGTYSMMFHSLSSHIGIGTYELKWNELDGNDYLYLTETDQETVYVFKIEAHGDEMIFMEDMSTGYHWGSGMKQGTKFIRQNYGS